MSDFTYKIPSVTGMYDLRIEFLEKSVETGEIDLVVRKKDGETLYFPREGGKQFIQILILA